MENVKITKVKAIEFVLENFGTGVEIPTEVKEKLEGMIEQISKKNSCGRKLTPTQVANEEFKGIILEYLGTVEKATVSGMLKGIAEFSGLSNQRVSAIVRQLKEANLVVRTEEKGKAYFSLVTEEE